MSYTIIYGPPGTGKTTELLNRMAATKNVGFLGFTRAAAQEALTRLNLKKSKTIRTIHSLAYELSDVSKSQIIDDAKLREFSQFIGYPYSGHSSVEGEPQQLADELLEIHNFSQVQFLRVEDTIQKLGRHIDPAMAEMFSDTYTRWKNAYGYMDFNDILIKAEPVDMGIDNLFVDEAQDLSPLQWRFIDKIKTQNTTIAGDDDQAIFSWAGADPQGMSKKQGTVEVLDKSHRLPKDAFFLASGVASQIKDRVPKSFKPQDKAGKVKFWSNINYLFPERKDTLILHRNHSSRIQIEDWLAKNYVPYTLIGTFAKSMFEDKYANALRTYYMIRDGLEISQAQMNTLKRCVKKNYADLLTLPMNITAVPWFEVLEMPYKNMEYLSMVNLFEKPKIRVSTIHTAKGMEADRVILMNESGNKTYESLDDDEWRVWYVAVTRTKDQLDIVNGDNCINLEGLMYA